MRHNLVWIALTILILLPVTTLAQTPNRAGLVVQFPDGQVQTACVEFQEDRITGLDLLNRSGLVVNVDFGSGLGARVCKIDETGCDAPGEPCFCQCLGAPCYYWNYWTLKDGQWSYSPLGASSHHLIDGDMDGWVWSQGKEPPVLWSLDEICPTQTDADALTLTPDTSTPRPTSIPSPVLPTAWPSVTPLTDSPAPTPVSRVYVPLTSGQPPELAEGGENEPRSSPERYVGFVGVATVLSLVALIVWRRQKGV
ncbi:MAG: hypothetical protein ACOYZ7_11755 [Chloroflexota bacterium]